MKVWNVKDGPSPKGAVFVGRPTKWGNPFHVGMHGTREEVVEKYRAYLREWPELIEEARRELVGKDLVCFCAPEVCHADVLMAVASGGEP